MSEPTHEAVPPAAVPMMSVSAEFPMCVHVEHSVSKRSLSLKTYLKIYQDAR